MEEKKKTYQVFKSKREWDKGEKNSSMRYWLGLLNGASSSAGRS